MLCVWRLESVCLIVMTCPQLLAGRHPQHLHQNTPCPSRSIGIKAHSRTRQPSNPSPTPIDTAASSISTPLELTLIETQGRSQTTHTWSLSTTTNPSSSSSNGSSSNSSVSSQDEASASSSTGSSGAGTPALLYRQSQRQLSTGERSGQTSSSTLTDQVSRVREALSSLFLPAGYPSSVTEDYLPYQLATVPAHITGWLSISLVTSSLLKAVGISAGPVGATAAAAAAIKWITKDGIGAAGRLLVGGRLGVEFDDDPRRWRMAAEALATLGLSLEIATAIYPQHFLLLASLGNFSKAVGKGMGKPVFRVIQTHFAATGNVGAVAAKEEVWEVTAQLTGYALSVMLLQQLQDAGSWQTVVGIWALCQGAHVSLRYVALKTLRFRYLNQKRAKLLVAAHVRGQPLPTVSQGNQQEPFFATAADMEPHIQLGCSLAEAWGVAGPAQLQPEALTPWWRLYEKEGYLLNWRGGRAYVVLKEGVVVGGLPRHQRQQVLLRALWQAAWLDAHAAQWTGSVHPQHEQQQQQQQQQQQHGLNGDLQEGVVDQPHVQQQKELTLLQDSLLAVDQQFDSFVKEAEAAGWKAEQLVLRVGTSRVQQLSPAGSESDDLLDLTVG